jgi:general secretion pathway protein M
MKMSKLVKSVPALQVALRHYDSLSSREKKYVQFMAGALVLACLYFFIWQPSNHYMTSSREGMHTAAETLSFVQQNIGQASIAAQLTQNSQGALDPQSMVSTISTAGKKYNVELKRFEPSGESKLRVWLEDVPFNSVVQWLQDLDKSHSLKVSEISIDRDEKPGLVNARLLIGP